MLQLQRGLPDEAAKRLWRTLKGILHLSSSAEHVDWTLLKEVNGSSGQLGDAEKELTAICFIQARLGSLCVS